MGIFISSLGHNLRNLIHFSGQDTRSQFWPWGSTIFIVGYLGFSYIGTYSAVQILAEYGAAVGEGNLPVDTDLGAIWMPQVAAFVIVTALLAASVTRRLRDVGHRGYWALVPAAFFLASIAYAPAAFRYVFSEFAPEPSAIAFLSPLGFWVSLFVLIFFLARDTKKKANNDPPRQSRKR